MTRWRLCPIYRTPFENGVALEGGGTFCPRCFWIGFGVLMLGVVGFMVYLWLAYGR